MKSKFLKTLFSNKKNIFLLLLSFFIMSFALIFSTATSMPLVKQSAFVNLYPDSLCVRHNVLYKNLDQVIEKYYQTTDHYEVLKLSTYSNKTNITKESTEKVFPINIFGIDDNFLNIGLEYDEDKKLNFNSFTLSGNMLDDQDLIFGATIFYTNQKGIGLIDSELVLFGTPFSFGGMLTSKISEDKNLNIYLPITAFKEVVVKNVDYIDSITVDIYSLGLGNSSVKDVFTKNTVISIFNEQQTQQNQNMLFVSFLLVISLVSISILVSSTIKNRHNEIGIKLAVGARKIDVSMEITKEMTAITILGTALGFGFGIYVSLIIGSISSIINGVLMIYINFPLAIFAACCFILSAIVCSLLCCLFGVNNNIESILKEER